MKKIELDNLDLIAYEEELPNKLKVYYLPTLDKSNYYIGYATYFGANITSFYESGKDKEIHVPNGIAHFLEHKTFAQKDGIDPFTFFSASGTSGNAMTSYDSTNYICYGTKNFIENLKYLIKFVNSPYYTAENVNSEKGIITEEIKMYEDDPDWFLESTIRNNIYHKDNRKKDIGGTVKDINNITTTDLYNCYNNFYAPANMFLLLIGNFPLEKASIAISEAFKDIPSKEMGKPKDIKEAKSIVKKEEVITKDIGTPKLAIALKVALEDIPGDNRIEKDIYLEMITTLMFGTSSSFRENARKNRLINTIYSYWEPSPDYNVYYLMLASDNINELLKAIKSTIKDFTIIKEEFERVKKVWASNEVKLFDYVDSITRNIYDDIVRYKQIIPNKVAIINSLDLFTINKIYSNIDFNNMAVVKMLPSDKK